MNWIVGTKEFNENLDLWLSKNDQKYAEYLYKNRDKIPPVFRNYSSPLYRGMNVDHEFIVAVTEGKMTFKNHTSWTKSQNIAKKFTSDPAYNISKSTSKPLIPILITKKISQSSIIINIHAFVSFMGIPQLEMQGVDETSLDSAVKEEEVLVSKNIKISKNDIKFI